MLFAKFMVLSQWIFGGVVALSCSPYRPFPIPVYSKTSFEKTFDEISKTLTGYFADPLFNATNVAVEVTSSRETLWGFYHAAVDQSSQMGAAKISPDTIFRVARVSKLLTAIAVLRLHDQGHIKSLHDPVLDYFPELQASHVQWARITTWDLLNNLAGIADMYGYADILTDLPAWQRAELKLPPVPEHEMDTLPPCQLNKSIPCDTAGLLSWMRSSPPVFDPHVLNSNSNVGFSLLGIMIARITGTEFEQHIREILLDPIGLNSTSFTTPERRNSAVLRGDRTWDWDVGINNPSVGLYSTARDISTLLRWSLTTEATSILNWFAPGFYAAGCHSLIGMPWNIFRTNSALPDADRPVAFNTVVGTLGPYTSVVVVLPEYDLAFSLMLSGALGHPHGILENISFPVVRAAERIAWEHVQNTYAGRYEADASGKINSSITLLQSPSRGLYISEWISNGTSILPVVQRLVAEKSGGGSTWIFQAVPTFLRPKRREMMDGREYLEEEWRWTYVLDRPSREGWNDWCLSSFDPVTYAGRPLTKMVFQKDVESERVLSLTMSGYAIELRKILQGSEDSGADLVLNQPEKALLS